MAIPLPSTRALKITLAGAALTSGMAHGALIYQDFETTLTDTDSTIVNSDTTIGSIHFDGSVLTLDHDNGAVDAISFAAVDDYLFQGAPKVNAATMTVSGSFSQLSEAIPAGETLSLASNWIESSEPLTGSGTGVFAGFKTGSDVGWIRYDYTADGKTIVIHDAVVETDPNTPVVVGVVPEASGMGLAALALGAAGLRRRRSS